MLKKVSDITYPLGRVYFDYKNKIKSLEIVALLTMLLSWTMLNKLFFFIFFKNKNDNLSFLGFNTLFFNTK